MSCFQNCQTNTCKNESAKPMFMRVPRGYRRNEKEPAKGVDTIIFEILVICTPFSVEMKKSPLRALTHTNSGLQVSSTRRVEMKRAR